MKATPLPELLARIQREHAEANADRPPPKVRGSLDLDPQPFIDGWHNR